MSATAELAARIALWWLDHKPLSPAARARRQAKRAARKAARQHPPDEYEGEFFTDEVPMVNSALATQILLAILRHAMTAAAPLGVTVSDDWLVQTSALAVGAAGIVWSGIRKWRASKGR